MLFNIECSEQQCSLMIDCGSDISVLKASKIKYQQKYNPNDFCTIAGIGEGTVYSYGSITTNLQTDELNIQQKFHLVDDNFPIPTDGILGRDFLAAYKCCIDYNSWIITINYNNNHISVPINEKTLTTRIIPPRCEIIKKLEIPNLNEDMVTIANEIKPGLMYANCIINNDNKFVKFINTTTENVFIPTNFVPTMVPLRNFYITDKSANNVSKNTRNNQLLQELQLDHIDPQIKQELEDLCMQYNDIFALQDDNLTVNNFYEQEILLNDKSAVYIKNYRTPETQKLEIDQQIGKMLDQNIIQNSTSPYNSPILLVPKKNNTEDKKWRLVVDYRQLNKRIVPDKFPLPRIDEILDQLGRAKYFSTLDLMSGFHQIPLQEHCKRFTAFTAGNGHYEFNRLPFGLNISPNSFQRMMTLALSGLPPECAFLYVDDVIVIGCSLKHHLINLGKIFERMRSCNLKLNPTKCCFFKSAVTFLGHHVSATGIQPDKGKYNIIKNYPTPKNADETRRFVAFCNYYRRFIPNFAEISYPLNQLTKKNANFNWNETCQVAFLNLKQQLLSPRILKFPNFKKDFILTTDASKVACGAVLAQAYDDIELPVSFASRIFTKGESNKSTIERELAAIHWAIKYFRPYLYGRKFIIKTDHRPLVYLFTMKDPSSKLTQMRLDLEEYDFTVQYIKGESNVVSDALSRVHLDVHELKNMYVITRSMTNNKTNVPTVQPAPPESDHLRVFDAMNGLEAFNLSKISFIFNQNTNKIELYLFNKNYKKNFALVQDLELNNKRILKPMLQRAFEAIDKGIPMKTNNLNMSMKTRKMAKQFAIASNDLIFNYVDDNLFKEIGNKILRNVTVLIFEKPKIVRNDIDIKNILDQYHNSPVGGHIGINRLYKKLRPIYFWQNMKAIITHYVKNCTKCKLNKHFTKIQTPAVVTTTPTKPFEVVSIDTVGPFPLSENGNRYAVSMQCDFTKFVILVPIPDKTATTMAKAVVEKCILIFGPMVKIKTDQGTEFKAIFDEVCKTLKITHICSAAYHPQTIGALERNHRCLNEYLRIFCNERMNDWDNWMPYYSFCYNTTPNLDHNYTPFELLFARKSNIFEIIPSKISPLYNHESYLYEMKYRLQVAHTKVLDAIQKIKQKRTHELNQNHRSDSDDIKTGDIVYLALENRTKLDQVNEGPFKVISTNISNVTIVNEKNKPIEVHKSRLLKFKT